MNYVPYVLEGSRGKERVWDIWSRLNKDRIIFLSEAITGDVANRIVAQLLYLESEDRTTDIQMYINSPGGVITGGLAIYDAMNHVKPNVSTLCFGTAASMAAVLFAAGEPGKRFMLPNAEVMIHQPMGGAEGQVSDMEISIKRIQKMKNKLAKILSDKSGKSVKKVLNDMDRDYWMDAYEAVKYGLCDKVLEVGNEEKKTEVE